MPNHSSKKLHADVDFTLRRVFGKTSFRYDTHGTGQILISDWVPDLISVRSLLLLSKVMMFSYKLVGLIISEVELNRADP